MNYAYCSKLFVAGLFVIKKKDYLPKHESIGDQLNKQWNTHTMEN